MRVAESVLLSNPRLCFTEAGSDREEQLKSIYRGEKTDFRKVESWVVVFPPRSLTVTRQTSSCSDWPALKPSIRVRGAVQGSHSLTDFGLQGDS